MYFRLGRNRFTFGHWSGRAEAEEILRCCSLGFVMLGEDTYFAREFFSLFVEDAVEPNGRFGIGICSEGHGIRPEVLPDATGARLYFGFNQRVVCFDIRERKVVFEEELDSLFHQFIDTKDRLLIVEELGLRMLTTDGAHLWCTIDTLADIIVNIRLLGTEHVQVEFLESGLRTVCLASGALREG